MRMNFKQDIIPHTFRNKYLKYTGGGYITSKSSSSTDQAAAQLAKWFYEDDEGSLHSKLDFVSDLGLTAYGLGNRTPSTILDGLLIDETTLSKEGGKLSVIGGTGGGGVSNWEDLEGKPTWITDAKPVYNWSEIVSKPETFTPSSHTHIISNITNLQATLDNKSNIGHTHNISNITSLQSLLDSKLNASSYTANDVLSKIKSVDGSGSGLDADLLDGLHSSRFPIYYNLTMSSTSNYWYKLGTARISESDNIMIHIYGGDGWNSNASQNAYATLMIKAGYNPSGGLTREFGATMVNHHHSNMTYKLISPSNDTVDIWVKMPYGYSNGWYSIHGEYASYIHNGASQSAEPTGNVQTGVEVLTNAYTSSNVASATQLQTARTIWGQSFNGTANVSGNMTGVGSIAASGDIVLSQNGSTGVRQIRMMCGDNDYGRIAAGATGSNAGWMEIASADDGNEPIYVRQYTGVYSTVKRTLTLLDGSGNTTIPGNLVASGGITCYASDKRAKDIVNGISLSLKDIADSPTVRFRWNNWNIKDDGKTHIGGIAQYVQNILPEAVLDANGILNMDYATTAYIYSVQTARHLEEANKEIARLKEQIAQLKDKLKLIHNTNTKGNGSI